MPTGDSPTPDEEPESSRGATEPLTLTDPDGAVTVIAPWSTWTREQVRAPGGEPSMVTRLEQGQVWFSAGRPRSPWRHEVRVGATSVSTADGRFHVTAEADGGATVDCLAGRTRVVSGLDDPVELEADQTAAVASDGGTLVVLDAVGRGAASDEAAGAPIDLTDATGPDPAPPLTAAAVGATLGAASDAHDEPDDAPATAPAAAAASTAPAALAGAGAAGVGAGPGGRRRERSLRLPEIVAVAALLGVLLAAVIVFGRQPDYDTVDVAAPPASSSTVPVSTTTELRTSTTAATTSTVTSTAPVQTTTEVVTTTVPVTTSPPSITNPAQATGLLAACRRADGGVVATINVRLRSGGPGRFRARVGLVGANGQVFATGESQTDVLQEGASAPVDVMVNVPGRASGACELLGVEAV